MHMEDNAKNNWTINHENKMAITTETNNHTVTIKLQFIDTHNKTDTPRDLHTCVLNACSNVSCAPAAPAPAFRP